MRPVVLHTKARDSLRSFPKESVTGLAKRCFSFSQDQPRMPRARPTPAVATCVSELRIQGYDGQFRVFYFAASSRIDIARRRLKEMLQN